MKYSHIDYGERVKIEVLLKLGHEVNAIAKTIGRHPSTIYREIHRNTKGKEIYLADRAHKRYVRRAFWQRYRSPLKDSFIWNYVINNLRENRWSPEIIAGRLSVEFPDKKIHYTTIYKCIHGNKFHQHMQLSNFLLRKGKGKRWRNVKTRSIEDKVMIEDRPKDIERREELGHWESDLMEGIRGDRKTVTVTVERKSRYMIAKVGSKKSEYKTRSILSSLKGRRVKSITVDNGSENAGHRVWKRKLKTEVYFCNPYRSWEKGTVENSIGWLRRTFKKKKSIEGLTHQKLAYEVKRYNQTPRKVLNYLTPEEVYMRESNQI